jgi:hypothetical protein
MVNAHLHHVPVVAVARVLGVEPTCPADWLRAPLSWSAFAAHQLAVAVVLAGGLSASPAMVGFGSAVGATGWLLMTANVAQAWIRMGKSARFRATTR